jgi:serine/threonine-protein kinase
MSAFAEQAEELLARFLVEREGGAVELEALLAGSTPELAAEVRRLAALCQRAEAELARLPADPQAPEVARYYVEGELGRGGMGRVFAVFDRELERPLAMKVLPAGAAPGTRRRFLVVAKLTGGLDHPGIVAVHELGNSPAGLWFTMARVRGDTLETLIPRARAGQGGWSLARATQVLLRVCEAVAYAHSRGILHRDLKPANVMVGAFGETYVMDWGLARRLAEPEEAPEPGGAAGPGDAAPAGLTRAGDVVGTPAYMAPEQARGEPGASAPALDVYALGAMLYQLLSGRPPHQDPGADSSPRAVLARAASAAPAPLERLAPRAPAELIAIAVRAMAADPRQRYPDVLALAEDLRAFLEGRVVRAYESGGWAELRKWMQRNRRLAFALAGLLAAIVLGTAATFEVRGRERARALRFYDLQLVGEARAEAELELWPETPERLPDFEAWLARAEALLARAPAHRAELALLDAEAERAAQRPRFDPGLSAAGFTFADPDRRWRHERLRELVQALDEFAAPDGSLAAVRERRDWARSVRRRTLEEPAARWSESLERLGDDGRFVGLRLEPQLGLVPLGRDPESGLEEFALLRSGSLPERDPQGRLRLAEDSALILVLLPGGEFELGREDELALSAETPRHRLLLAPFLLAKHELTQAQWRALGGRATPFFAGAGRGRWPMESITWAEAQTLLEHHGLSLPTEAQWEFAALAGDSARYPWGEEPERLFELAVLEQPMPAPVGTRPSERFGLFDLLGNVAEWCLDPLGDYSDPVSGPNALRQPATQQALRRHVVRGGYHSAGLSPEERELAQRLARPRTRLAPPAEQRSEHRGLRAAAAWR